MSTDAKIQLTAILGGLTLTALGSAAVLHFAAGLAQVAAAIVAVWGAFVAGVATWVILHRRRPPRRGPYAGPERRGRG